MLNHAGTDKPTMKRARCATWKRPASGRRRKVLPVRADLTISAYVAGDPVNAVDPSGTCRWYASERMINICGDRLDEMFGSNGSSGGGASPGASAHPSCTEFTAVAVPNWDPGCGGATGLGESNPVSLEPEIVVIGDKCSAARQEQGIVHASGFAAEGALALGLNGSFGEAVNTLTGTRVNFYSVGFSAGVSVGLGPSYQTFNSMGDFVGYAESSNGGAFLPFAPFGVGGLGAGGSIFTNIAGDVIGRSGSWTFGPAQPRFGLSAAASETTIFNCRFQ